MRNYYQNGKLNGAYKLWLDKDQLETSGTLKTIKNTVSGGCMNLR